MKASTKNISRGSANVVAGKTKELAGKAVRSPKLQAKGIVQKARKRVASNRRARVLPFRAAFRGRKIFPPLFLQAPGFPG